MITQNINGTENGHSFVDLGLPSGLLWATCNVGAKLPWETGPYFAWGETTGFTAEQVKEGKRRFNDKSYKAKPVLSDLRLKDDAAHVNMGGKWRMPTKEEFQELMENCDSEWTEDYNGTGMVGYLFTSKTNGISVFFPTAGYCRHSSVGYQSSVGYYWAASWSSSSRAWYLYFDSGDMYMDYDYRFFGYSVRGVYERL